MLEFIYTFYHNSIVFSVIERYSDNSQEIIISQSERVFLVFIPPMPKTFSFRAITCPSILFKKLFPNMNVHNIILTNFAQALPINNFQVVRIIYIERIDTTDNTNKSLATLEGPWVHTTIIRYMHKIIIPRVVPITANILPIIVLTFFAVPVFFFFFLTMLSSILIPHYLPLLLF